VNLIPTVEVKFVPKTTKAFAPSAKPLTN